MLSTTFSKEPARRETLAEVVARIYPPQNKKADEIMRASVLAAEECKVNLSFPPDASPLHRKLEKLRFTFRRRNEILKQGHF